LIRRAVCQALLLAAAFSGSFSGMGVLRAQTAAPMELPDAPQPPAPAGFDHAPPAPDVAELSYSDQNPSATPLPQQGGESERVERGATQPGFPPVSPVGSVGSPIPLGSRLEVPWVGSQCLPGFSSPADARLCCDPQVNPFARYLSSQSFPLTARGKFILAEKNIRDPFNLLTVGGEAAISIAADSHTAYGPGFPGFAKYAGVSLTQEMVGQFFGTFLIPSLAHQDPHYYRMANLPLKRRIFHVLDAVVISQSDDGQPMFNYATVFGTIGTNALGNVYVPGRRNSWGASAERVAVSLATDPIGNAISEFMPDVARRININVVLVQRVIDRVAIEAGAAPAQ
jgi:hypothetical protein